MKDQRPEPGRADFDELAVLRTSPPAVQKHEAATLPRCLLAWSPTVRHLPHHGRPVVTPPRSPTLQLPGLMRASPRAEKSANPPQRAAAFAKKR